MPLTPADIHNVAFKRPPLGKRGYDEEEVDSFLDEVEQQLIRLIEETEELRGRIRHGGPPAASNGMNAANGGMTAEHAQVAAQLQRAQQDRARAEDRARALQQQLEQAPPAAERPATFGAGTSAVMMMAQRTADDHMQEAHRESESMLANARDKSVQIGGEAQRKASDTESDARRRHTEAIANIEIERAALLDEIDRLARLAESYQAALNEHVRAQLQWLESAPETAR